MPDNQQERIVSNAITSLLEEIVLIGVGVLLVFLGVFGSVFLTNLLSVGIGSFLFYIAFESYRIKFPKENIQEEQTTIEFEHDAVTPEPSPRSHMEHPIDQQKQIETPKLPQKSERSTMAYSATDFFQERQTQSMNQAEPQSEFNNLLLKSLEIVKEACFAHSVTFFWVKNETRQLVVEAKITDSNSFTTDRKISIGSDIVSRISVNGQPQVVNNILPETERDVLCYYKSLQGIRSFIGVPVFYAGESSSQPIGVISVDSKAEDAYGEETFAMLSHVSKLISSILISYTEKYDLFSDVKLIEAETNLRKKISGHPMISAVVNGLTEELENIVAWESISVILHDEGLRDWAVASTRVRGSDRFVSPKQLIDFRNSIVGQSIQSNSLQTVMLERNTKTIFNEHERSSDILKHGMLVVVPISSGGKCFGAVVVTGRDQNTFSKKDIDAVQSLASIIAPEFEIAELNSILGEHIAVDELTGAMSKKYFSSRLNEELFRATDREEDLSLVFVTVYNVDDIQHRYDDDGREAALIHVARHLRASVRPYDVVARYDASTFAVVLADTIANDAFLWAEKLRTAIAGSIVTVGKKSFSISVTVGISGASSKMSGDELIKNVAHVLDLAKKAGGNIVRVF